MYNGRQAKSGNTRTAVFQQSTPERPVDRNDPATGDNPGRGWRSGRGRETNERNALSPPPALLIASSSETNGRTGVAGALSERTRIKYSSPCYRRRRPIVRWNGD